MVPDYIAGRYKALLERTEMLLHGYDNAIEISDKVIEASKKLASAGLGRRSGRNQPQYTEKPAPAKEEAKEEAKEDRPLVNNFGGCGGWGGRKTLYI